MSNPKLFLHTHLLASPFPCEIGYAAFFSNITSQFKIGIMSIDDSAKLDLVEKDCGQEDPFPRNIIMIGTYWEACLQQFAANHPETKIFVLCPGQALENQQPNVEMIVDQEPGKWLSEYVLKTFPEPSIQAYVRLSRPALELLDDRYLSRNLDETQVFFSGIYNLGGMQKYLSDFEKLKLFFGGQITMDLILAKGKLVMDVHSDMARKRVIDNSKLVKIGGASVAVGVSNDLINLVHSELHKRYPEAHVSLVLGIHLTPQSDKHAYSFRSYSDDVDVSLLSNAISGGGSKKISGGKLNATIKYDLVEDGIFF